MRFRMNFFSTRFNFLFCFVTMIKRHQLMQCGFLRPPKFNQIEITKRCYNLKLSRHHDVENVHTAGINSLDIERSENSLLSGCADGSIYVHDVYNLTGQPFYTVKCICKVVKNSNDAHRYGVECVSWYKNDNALFITSGTDKTLKIWDSNSLKSIEEFHFKGRIFQHNCSEIPTSQPIIAVASSANHVELIDLRTGGSTHELRGHNSSVISCTWSPAEEYLLVSGGMDKKILMWDIRSSNCCLKNLDQNNKNCNAGTAHSGFINGLKFTSDGLFLVSLGMDNKIRLWETVNGFNQEIHFMEIKNNVKKNIQFAISDNSKPPLLYVPSEGNIYVFELLSGQFIKPLHGHFHSVNCCFFHNSHQELYSGGNDRNILLWTADTPQLESSCENLELGDNDFLKNDFVKTRDIWSSDED